MENKVSTMLIKIHKSYRSIIAICDKELLGRKLEQKNTQLDLSGEFFNGEKKTESEILNIIEDAAKEDACFNIVGKKAINCALKAGIIDKKGIKKIQGVPVALTLL